MDCMNEFETAPVYWPPCCLLLHHSPGPLTQDCQHQTQILAHPISLNVAQILFARLEPACVDNLQNHSQHPLTIGKSYKRPQMAAVLWSSLTQRLLTMMLPTMNPLGFKQSSSLSPPQVDETSGTCHHDWLIFKSFF